MHEKHFDVSFVYMNLPKMFRTLVLTLVLTITLRSSYCIAQSVADRIPYEAMAGRVIELLKTSDFAQLDKQISGMISGAQLTRSGYYYPASVILAVFEKPLVSFEAPLHAWIHSDSRNTNAYMMRGFYFYFAAWEARGSRFVDKVGERAGEVFAKKLALSEKDFLASLSIDADNPMAVLGMLQLLRSKGGSRSDHERYFQHATLLIPGFVQAYREKVMFLSPKWGGSASDSIAFARASAEAASEGSPLKLLPYMAHEELCSNYGGKKSYFSRPEVWKEIESAFPSIIQHFPKSALYPLWYAEAAVAAQHNDIADTFFNIAREREPLNPRVIKAVSKYESRKQKTTDNSTIDTLRPKMDNAYHLFKTGDLTAAENSYRSILKIDPTKSFAWQMLGKISEKRSDFSGAVKHYDEALKYSPRSDSTLTNRCYALMMLQKYDQGISDCTKAIALNPKAKYAYLNRGRAYQFLGRTADAEADFATAARLP